MLKAKGEILQEMEHMKNMSEALITIQLMLCLKDIKFLRM